MPLVQGTLVIADISGYTRYIAGTEAEHSVEILTELLSVITRSFEGRLSIDQLEGDAICATTDRRDAEVAEWLDETFGGFHRRLRDIRAATTCPCRACASVGDLGLKFFVHTGEFSRQTIGGRVQLFGSDVNLVHRLTKNDVPLREYVYATAAALGAWPPLVGSEFIPAPQTYDLGLVEGSYRDLAPVRESALRELRTRVTPDEARVHFEETLDVPIDVAWRMWTDPAIRVRWMGVERLDFLGGARGTYLGGEFHCHHGGGQMTVLRVVGVEPPREITITCGFGPEIPVAFSTDRLTPREDGRTQYDCYWTWPEPEGDHAAEINGGAIEFLKQMAIPYSEGIRRVMAELAAEVRAPRGT